MISLRLWGQAPQPPTSPDPLIPPPFPGPPPHGHRWRMKMVPAQTVDTNKEGIVTVTTMTVVQSEPIVKQVYYAILPGGVFEYVGDFESDADALRFLTSKVTGNEFPQRYDSVMVFPNPRGLPRTVWQFDMKMHTRTNESTAKSVGGGVRVAPRSPIVMPPMPAPLVLMKSKSAAMPIPKVLVQGPRLALYITNLLGWDTNLLQPTLPVTNIVVNISSNAQSGPLNVYCTPAVAVYFASQLGVTYECQASDDFGATWLPGPPTPGTGGVVTIYDLPKLRRFYRVKQS